MKEEGEQDQTNMNLLKYYYGLNLTCLDLTITKISKLNTDVFYIWQLFYSSRIELCLKNTHIDLVQSSRFFFFFFL